MGGVHDHAESIAWWAARADAVEGCVAVQASHTKDSNKTVFCCLFPHWHSVFCHMGCGTQGFIIANRRTVAGVQQQHNSGQLHASCSKVIEHAANPLCGCTCPMDPCPIILHMAHLPCVKLRVFTAHPSLLFSFFSHLPPPLCSCAGHGEHHWLMGHVRCGGPQALPRPAGAHPQLCYFLLSFTTSV